MNIKTAEILCKLNTEFYAENSFSFAQTRHAPWPGWKRGIDLIRDDLPAAPDLLSIFDLACGNLRFEAFLEEELSDKVIEMYALDNCSELLPATPEVQFQNIDVLEELLAGNSLNELIEAPLCDVSVSFGFMHHVPGLHFREKILRSLIRQTKSSGYVMVSFWQFLNNEALKEKALITHKEAIKKYVELDLDEGDFLLGWKNMPGVYRYCHSFSESEIDQLVESVEDEAQLFARFSSDGRGDNLNTYLIFKVGE